MAMSGIEQDEIIDRLDRIIGGVAPKAVSLPKYGGTLYTLKPDEKEAQFCGIFPYSAHVQLAFSHGYALADPKGVLLGNGKYRRHIKFHSPQEIEPDVLIGLLTYAVKDSLARGAG